MTGAVDAFVDHALGARWEDLPGAALTAVKTFVLDTIGVGVAGAQVPLTAQIRAAAMRWSAVGEHGAHVWGPGAVTTTPANAAFINGFQIHCQEFDCVHEPAVVHPMATVCAALMAECERKGPVTGSATGRAFAMAVALAVDVAAGLGLAATTPLKFFRPANAGIFGAALGIARLRGFDEGQAKNALGYALAFCSGTMQAHAEGKPALPVQIANAARGAVMACDLAEMGVPGPQDSVEGPFGYFALFEDGYDLAPVIADLGRVWRIGEVSHKPFPTGRAAQGGIVLMGRLREQGVTPEAVEAITLTAPPLIKRLVGRPALTDMTVNYARLCFAYSGAVALRTGAVGLGDFAPAALRDPETLALARRISIVDDGSGDPAAFAPQTLRATLKDASVLEARLAALYGAPGDPLSREAHLAKFRSCMAFGFGAPHEDLCDALIELTDTLETLDDVRRLARLAAGGEDRE